MEYNKINIWLSVISCVMLLSHVAAQDECVQIGIFSCLYDPNTGIMTASFGIDKVTADTYRTYFTNQTADDLLDDYYGDEAGCQWTGNGTAEDPFSAVLRIDTATNMAPAGEANCGHILVVPENKTYRWEAYNQGEFEISRTGDCVLTFECSAFDLPTEISTTNITKRFPEILDVPSQIGTAELYLVQSPSISQETRVSSPVSLGDTFYARLRFQPSGTQNPDVIDPELSSWGVYCKDFYVTPYSSNNYQTRREDLLGADGCPDASSPFLRPASGFTALNGMKPDPGDLYYSTTGTIEAARFDMTLDDPVGISDSVFFVCEAELCWKPDDSLCIEMCPSVGGRKRRSIRPYFLVANLTVTINKNTQQHEPNDSPEDSKAFLAPLLAAMGGVAVLALIIIVGILICHSRNKSNNYTQHKCSTSSLSSTPGRPYDIKGHHSSCLDKRVLDYQRRY